MASSEEGLLTVAARALGHAAGKAARAIAWQHADSKASAASKTPKRRSARVRRKEEATELKGRAAESLPKNSSELGAPYRRVMGKPAANWTIKDIDYVRGLMAKHGGGGVSAGGSDA